MQDNQPVTPTEQPLSIVSNSPAAQNIDTQRKAVEDELKAELLKELSLDDVRQIITLAKSGTVYSHDAPDSFDELGRNFHRMVRRVKIMGTSGEYWTERPMARNIDEARKEKKDYYDPVAKVWIRSGYKREMDYPENTVDYWDKQSEKVEASS